MTSDDPARLPAPFFAIAAAGSSIKAPAMARWKMRRALLVPTNLMNTPLRKTIATVVWNVRVSFSTIHADIHHQGGIRGFAGRARQLRDSLLGLVRCRCWS